MKTLGQQLKEYREKANLTQLQVSQRLGYESMQFIHLMESGRSKVPFDVLGKMFVVLNIPQKQQDKIINAIISDISDGITKKVLDGIKSIK